MCGLPLSHLPADGICPTCEEHLPHCLGCGKSITGRRFHIINGAGPYCDQCHKEPPVCDVCGHPLNNKRWQLSDGRIFCERCYTTTINDPAEARDLYNSTSETLGSVLNLGLNVPTPLVLVDRNQLAEVMSRQKVDMLEPPERTLGIYARRGIKRGIYLQTGLPKSLFRQVVAHELAHAWQGENCPLLHDPLVREGFAEWVAYKVMQLEGDETQRALMLQRNDLYGQGLKWALDVERAHGWQAVIEACHQTH